MSEYYEVLLEGVLVTLYRFKCPVMGTDMFGSYFWWREEKTYAPIKQNFQELLDSTIRIIRDLGSWNVERNPQP